MPYNVELPNGTIIEDIPDSVSREQAYKMILEKFPELAPKPKVSDYLKDIPKALGRGAVGFGETAGIGLAAALPEEYEAKARKGIESLAQPAQEYLAPSSREVGESIPSKLASAVGSTLPFFAAAPFGIPGAIAAAGAGVAAGAGEARQAAEEKGATKEERRTATMLGAPVGFLDVIAPEIKPFKGLLTTAAMRGGVEGLTEAAQKIAQNLIAKGVYDPKQEITVGAGEEGAYGAGAGALASLIVDMTLGRRARAPKAETPEQPVREAAPAVEPQAPVGGPLPPEQAQDVYAQLGQLQFDQQAYAQQMAEQRAAEEEQQRLAGQAMAQESARGLAGFGGPADINADLISAARADRAAEQQRLLEEQKLADQQRQQQIDEINATQFSPDPFQNEIMRSRALADMGVTPQQQLQEVAKPPSPDELVQEIPSGEPKKKFTKFEPPKTIPLTAEEQDYAKQVKTRLDEVDTKIKEAEKTSTDLFKTLEGKLKPDEVRAIFPEAARTYPKKSEMGKQVAKYRKLINTTGRGTDLSTLVSDGALDDYLPPQLRRGAVDEAGGVADEAAAVQYISNLFSSGATRTHDEAQNLLTLQSEREQLQQELNEPKKRADINYELQQAAERNRRPDISLQDLMAEAQSRGIDTDAIGERIAMQMPQATQEQYLGELHNQISTEIAAQEGRVAGQPITETLQQQKSGNGNVTTAEGKAIQKQLEGKSFDQVVQWMIKSAPNRFQQMTAERVRDMVQALKREGVTFNFDLQGGNSRNVMLARAEGVTTFLWGKEGTSVTVQLNGEPVFENQLGYPSGMSYGTIQHEMLHVATRTATRFLPPNHPVIRELNGLYNAVVAQYNKDAKAGKLPDVLQKYYKRMNNALASPDELITWGLTDREFQEYLANINVGPKQTAFSKFVQLVRDLLGIAKPFQTAMEKLVQTTEAILDIDTQIVKGEMIKQNVTFGTPRAPSAKGEQQSLFSKRVQHLMRDDLMVRKNGFYFDAKESPLYQTRTPEQARVVSQQDFESAVRGTKTGQRIMDKNVQIKDGDYVGVRLDLNILRSTGVPVQSIHQGKESTHEKGAGFYGGEVIKYAPWVTLKNVRFKIQQSARERIASGQETKSPMGSADGQYVKTDKPNFDGVELRFNPNREHLFRDALGRAVKYADEITTTRNGVFARGNIEYYGEEDVPPVAVSPSESRLMREGEETARADAAQTGNVSKPIQESLFMQQGIPDFTGGERQQYAVTNDGYIFFEQPDGRWSNDREGTDIIANSKAELFEAFLNEGHKLRFNYAPKDIEMEYEDYVNLPPTKKMEETGKIVRQFMGLEPEPKVRFDGPEPDDAWSPIRDDLYKAAAPERTDLGNGAMQILESVGWQVAKPEPTKIEKLFDLKNAYSNDPAGVRAQAYGSIRRFFDKVETSTFSSDAALNNQIRRAVMESTAGQEVKIGTLLNTSLSQTAHSDAVAAIFLREGNIRYNEEIHKWEGVKDENSALNLSKALDKITERAGVSKAEAELIAHKAFEARRVLGLIKYNEDLKKQAAGLRYEAELERANGAPVKASALSKQASAILSRAKHIHMSQQQLNVGMKMFELFPELQEVTDIWNGMRQNAMKVMVETGLYTQEEAEMLLSVAEYVPFYREEQLEEGAGPKEFLRSLSVQAEKVFKGTDKPVNDIFDNMIRWTQYAINRGVRNRSAVALADTAEAIGLASQVDDAKNGKNVVRVWKDGKQVMYSMEDPLFMDAFRGIESISIPTVKFFSKFADVLRQSVVLYPVFAIAQVPQDSFAAMFSSGLKAPYALSIPFRAVAEFARTLRGTSKAHEELKNVGAVGVRDFTSAIIRADAEIAAGLKQEKGALKKVGRWLGNLAMAADNAVRQAVYTAAIDQGLSRAEAMEKSFEIFNVRRRGSSAGLALAGQVIPFFNAYLAAQNAAYRTLTGVGTSPTERKAAFQTLLATTGSVMALSFLYAMMMGDDEDYIKKPTPTRDRLLMIPGTGGLGIPLRADLFLLPKALAEHTYLLMTDNGFEDGAKFRESMKSILMNSILSPTPVPQAIKPVAELVMNHDFFQNKPLVSFNQSQKELSRQFEDSTSELSKLLGKTNMISPIMADHFIRGMFGSYGGLVLYATNPILSAMSDTPRPDMTWRDAVATIPNMSAFVSKEYEPGLRKDFYALREVTDRVAATVSDLKSRSPQELADYLSDEQTRQRYALSKPVTQIANKLTEIRKRVNLISQMPEDQMTEEEKQASIKRLRDMEFELLKGLNIKKLRERAGM